MKRAAGISLAWRVLRVEGVAAFRDRLLDRLAGWRRRRAFRTVAVESRSAGEAVAVPLAEAPLLNVLPTPPRPDLGGVQVQLLRRLLAEAEHRPWALLYPDRGGYRLEIEESGRRRAVRLEAPAPPPPAGLADEAFEWAVRRSVQRVGARAVHFEQLAGWPLSSVANLGRSGLRQVISVHDFGLFCLRPHLLEMPAERFCGYCRDPQRCARCLGQDWRLGEGFQERRREVAREVLGAAEAVVYPSDFLRRTYLELFPGLETAKQWVVEPPSAVEAVPAPRLEPRRVRHLAYVGSVKPHKGALVLEELIRRLAIDAPADLLWSVYGGGDRDVLRRLSELPGVRLRGYYRAGALPAMLRRDGVDLALLPSIWPESYALTLDECLLAGVPVLAFDHGAIADRAREHGAGVLVPADAGAEGVASRLRTILDRGFRPEPSGGAAFQPPTADSAARRCLELYRQLGVLGG